MTELSLCWEPQDQQCALQARLPASSHYAERPVRDDLPKFVVAIGAAETAGVKHLLVGQETLHGVHGLLTFHTGLSYRCLKLLEKETDHVSIHSDDWADAEMGRGGLVYLRVILIGTTPAQLLQLTC